MIVDRVQDPVGLRRLFYTKSNFMRNYKDLDAWKNAMQLVKEVYLLTKRFPKEELYALTSQTKRAAVSVPSNIAKGLGRQYKKDT